MTAGRLALVTVAVVGFLATPVFLAGPVAVIVAVLVLASWRHTSPEVPRTPSKRSRAVVAPPRTVIVPEGDGPIVDRLEARIRLEGVTTLESAAPPAG